MADVNPMTAYMQDLINTGPNDHNLGFGTDGVGGFGNEGSQAGDLEEEATHIPQEAIDPGLDLVAHGPSRVRSIVEICRQLKQRKALSSESQAELDVFAKAHSAEEHMALLYAVTLENRDLLKSMRPEGSWVIPDALSENIRTYATAFLLSPTLSSYRGKVAKKLLDALRELNVAQLPMEKETAQIKQVLSCMSRCLTAARNIIKTQLKLSVDIDDAKEQGEQSDKVNIAALANAVIGKTGIKPTVQLYMRLAFLRWHVISYPDVDDDKWWLQVDENLIKWRKEFTTEQALSAAFTNMYNKDKTRFGDPAMSTFKVSEVRELDSWQTVLQAHARSVEAPNPKKRKQPTD